MIKTHISAIVLGVLMISTFSLRAQNQEELNILFIGNSFTARHDLNGLVKKILFRYKLLGKRDLYRQNSIRSCNYDYQAIMMHLLKN